MKVVDTLRREATEGQKHFALLRCAKALGGIQAAAGFSDETMVQWLLDALPDTVKDWKLATRTAKDGLARGRQQPIELGDRPHSGNGSTPPFVPEAEADGPAPDEAAASPTSDRPSEVAQENEDTSNGTAHPAGEPPFGEDDPPPTGWRPVGKEEVFEPGRHFRMNQTTGASEVYEPAGALPPLSDEPQPADPDPGPEEPSPLESEEANGTTPHDLRATVARLARLEAIDYIQQRDLEAKNLGIKVADLNAMVKEARHSHKAEQLEAEKRAKAEQAEQAQKDRPKLQVEAVDRLLQLDEAAYQRQLPTEAKRLGIPATALNKIVRAQRRAALQRSIAKAVDAGVAEFNKQYAVVLEGGKAVVYFTTYDPDLKREKIATITFHDLRKLYLNRTIVTGQDGHGQPIVQAVADVWLKSEDRLQYINGVVFDPAGKQRDGVLNLWKGFAVKAVKGDWSIMKDHIRKHICGDDPLYFEWFTGWLARLFQFPGEQAEVAIVLRGIEGTGKGTLARAIIRIFGRHGQQISNSRHLVGNFNLHLRDLVFLFPGEAFFAGDRANVGALNALITEPTLTIEGKGVNIGDPAPNRLHIMMASNETWVVPASAEARRYFVLDVLKAVVGNTAYFNELNEQMENGGYEAMLYDLLNYELTNFDHRHPPKTAALDEQKKLSLGTTDAWWKEVLDRGYVFQSKIGLHNLFGHWFSPVSKELLYKSYLQFAESRRERHPISGEAMGQRLLDFGCKKARPRNAIVGEEIASVTNNFGNPIRKPAEITKDRAQGYHIGTLDGAREAFDKATNITVEWGVADDFEEEPSDKEPSGQRGQAVLVP